MIEETINGTEVTNEEVITPQITLSNEQMIEAIRPRLQGINFSAIGFKNDKFRIYIKALADYEWMPFKLEVNGKDYLVDVCEELFLTILADNIHKENFYKRKNEYLESLGQEKQEFVLKQKNTKKSKMKLPEQVNLTLDGLSFK